MRNPAEFLPEGPLIWMRVALVYGSPESLEPGLHATNIPIFMRGTRNNVSTAVRDFTLVYGMSGSAFTSQSDWNYVQIHQRMIRQPWSWSASNSVQYKPMALVLCNCGGDLYIIPSSETMPPFELWIEHGRPLRSHSWSTQPEACTTQLIYQSMG